MKQTRTQFALAGLFLLLSATLAFADPLPVNRALIIQLSTIDSVGQITPAASTTTLTDAEGTFSFSFPAVPSAERAPFLLLQVLDGSTLLRQTIVPAPENGKAVEAGISEITDLQARTLLSAIAGAKKLTPVHLVLACTMVRSTAIAPEDVTRIATAINLAAEAFYASFNAPGQIQKNSALPVQSSSAITLVHGAFSSATVIPPAPSAVRVSGPLAGVPPQSAPSAAYYAIGMTSAQVAAFDEDLLVGLRRTMSLYRKSVDDSSASDPGIEALGRFDAVTLMMRELVSASASAGIPLDVTEWAYLAAGGVAETSLEQQGSPPAVKSLERMCFASGMLLYQAFSTVRSHTDALSTLGITTPTLQRYFNLLEYISINIPKALRGIDVQLANPGLSDVQAYEVQIFNAFATRDLVYMHAFMDTAVVSIDASVVIDTEYETLLANVINHMAVSSGVMNGMTRARLQAVMGSGTANPVSVFMLPVWLYLAQSPHYLYDPIPGLVTTAPDQPLFDQLAGAYLAQAQQQYEMALIQQLNYQDTSAAENAGAADVPPHWISLATAADLKRTCLSRRGIVRSRMSGLGEKEKDAIITISSGITGYGFF